MSKNIIKRLRNLPQNRNKTDEELLEDIENNTDTIEILAKLKDKDEKKLAKLLLENYLGHFDIENISDRGTLGQLIYLEVIQYRLQDKMNELYGKEAGAIPIDLLEVFQKNSEAIMKMKVSLGLTKSKDRLNTYDALQHLMKRFEKYGEENQASRHLKCPHCFQFIWLKIRTDAWEAQKHPFFRDTFLYNRQLMDNFGQTIKLTKEFLAGVFETSPDFIDWLVKKIKVTTIQNEEKLEQIDENTQPAQTTTTNGQKETSKQEETGKEGQVNGISGQPT